MSQEANELILGVRISPQQQSIVRLIFSNNVNIIHSVFIGKNGLKSPLKLKKDKETVYELGDLEQGTYDLIIELKNYKTISQ